MQTPTITQAMIDAYDEYTHLTLDRRRFMEKLTRLTGSAAAAAAIAPLLAADPARASIVTAEDKRIEGKDIAYPGAEGAMKGYLVRPAGQDGTLPAVMVIHENRGLNEHIRDVSRRLALEGFMALASRCRLQVSTHVYPMVQANEALDDLRAGRFSGAAVLVP